MEKHEDAWAGNGSSERAYRDETDDLEENGGDMDIDNVGRQDEDGELLVGEGKEKPRESGKHRSKDRKKGRREEKDHGSKDRGKLKEREKEDFSGKDSDKLDTRESDRMESRERRKENRSEYDKDREHEKDREKERSRDKIREKDYDRDKYRELERGKDRGRDRDKELDRERERSRSFDRELERGRDLGKDRGREREKDREIGREQESVRDYERGKEQDHVRNRDKDLERDRVKGHDRSRTRDKGYEKERQKELELERGKEKDHGRGMDQDHERGKDNERERERDRDRMKDRERGKEKIKDREKEREKEKEKDGNKLERDKGKERYGEKEKDKKWEMYRDKASNKSDTGRNKTRENDELLKVDGEDTRIVAKKGEEVQDEGDIPDRIGSKDHNKKSIGSHSSTSDLEERLVKMKVERLKRKSDGASEILSWVSKSRTLEEKKNAEKEKASRLSRAFEEQDNALEESEDEEAAAHTGKDLAGVKVLHGLDKVIEGGAVVLTLKDQNILANGDINEEIDMLENVELGEQKQRDEAYRAAKKKTGIYEDKFSDDTGMRKTILPQYDDPIEDEGVTLDESGRFTGEAEKKLEELRKRIEGTSTYKSFEDLTSSGKPSSDYYTPDEMLQFKKPKKKKSLRKKDKLDLDALEAEAISAGLGIGDLGTRNDGKKQSAKEEREKTEAKLRSDSYQSAYAKAEEASKALRQEKTLTVKFVEDDNPVFGEDYEDLQRALEQARKLAFRGQDESAVSGPQAVALSVAKKEQEDNQIPIAVEPQENKVVITEMEEFVLGLQLNEESHKPEPEDVFKDEEDVPKSSKEETEAEVGGWTEVKDTNMDEMPIDEEKEDIAPDESIHEVAFGKGLSGALKLLKERGTLKESIDWGGRNMDKKKSKLVGIYENDGSKEIRIERTDEFGRIMTPKEAFRLISHKFHGKGPGKMKQEKRMKQFQEELKLKQMKASDTPSLSAERMREAQARLKSPYLVLSGHVKPGQTSDPRSGFATVEKDHLGSLTPMLGDKKVEHFLGISRKPDAGSMGPPPPKKLKS